MEFEHFVLIFKAHSDYAIAGTSSSTRTRTHAFLKFINFICHQTLNIFLSYACSAGIELEYLFLVTILKFYFNFFFSTSKNIFLKHILRFIFQSNYINYYYKTLHLVFSDMK